ncbi:MAG: nuclear transport factor 2 family protein [Chloroflexi bacterium]|nr:nuclear transport factor 2 family protein [Chloroflexota bacterium]
MSTPSAGEVLERWIGLINARDYDALPTILTEDYINDWPQSGERIRGWRNLKATFENYPGGLQEGNVLASRVVAPEDRWLMTPTFTIVRVTGTQDVCTAVIKTRYPDGSDWYVVVLADVREGRIRKASTYFAPCFPAPEWRAQWVEPIGAGTSDLVRGPARTTTSARDIIEVYVAAINDHDFERIGTLLADDYVDDMPQSGERIRGRDNIIASLRNYPGGLESSQIDRSSARLIGDEDRWVMTPSFTVVRVTGSGDTFTGVLKSRYPDGSDWYGVTILEFSGSKIGKATTFYAPCFPAPEWRAQWVEAIPAG